MSTTFATIDALRESLAAPVRRARSPEYEAKMIHPVPDADVVDRVGFLCARAAGRVVLHVGASGTLHAELVKVAARVHGLDRDGDGAGVVGFDLDRVGADLPRFEGVELVVCGEILEHLGNPGHLLDRLRATFPAAPLVVTAPNAFSDIARRHMREGVENVNREHRCWYSWRTLRTLVEAAGYAVTEFHWYGRPDERPGFTEGLVFVLGAAGGPTGGAP